MHRTQLHWSAALCVAAALLSPGCTQTSADKANDDASATSEMPSRAPASHDVTIPAGTRVPVTLDVALASNANAVEDPVRATVAEAVVIDGAEVIPAGSVLQGVVTDAAASGKVQGRARLSFQFDQMAIDDANYDMAAKRLSYQARATKKEDAEKIGGGAAVGTVIGAIAGGKKGAAVGAAIGGGTGTAVVMSTSGEEIRLAAGTALTVELEAPLTVRVPDGI